MLNASRDFIHLETWVDADEHSATCVGRVLRDRVFHTGAENAQDTFRCPSPLTLQKRREVLDLFPNDGVRRVVTVPFDRDACAVTLGNNSKLFVQRGLHTSLEACRMLGENTPNSLRLRSERVKRLQLPGS